jgi:hypothetical protein
MAACRPPFFCISFFTVPVGIDDNLDGVVSRTGADGRAQFEQVAPRWLNVAVVEVA